jgi:peptidoglycan-associated lipoprotein
MKKTALIYFSNLLVLSVTLLGCCRSSDEVWEDTKSGTRHISRGVRTLCGNHADSRMVRCRDEFIGNETCWSQVSAPESEYIPIPDQKCPQEVAMADVVAPQPKESPGDPGSTVPGIEAFKDPHTVSGMSGIYKNVHFEYNSNLVKGQDNLDIIREIANNMRKNPNTYIFVEGHCDERGPEAYNLALGSRRSNAVRNALIKEGVNPDNIFTISYGKERPVVLEHHEEAWTQNRRAEFKVYQR